MTLDEFCEKWEVSEYGDGFLELSLKELNELLDETDDIEGNEKKAKELGDLALYHIERIEKRYGLDHANAWSRPKDCDMYDEEDEEEYVPEDYDGGEEMELCIR